MDQPILIRTNDLDGKEQAMRVKPPSVVVALGSAILSVLGTLTPGCNTCASEPTDTPSANSAVTGSNAPSSSEQSSDSSRTRAGGSADVGSKADDSALKGDWLEIGKLPNVGLIKVLTTVPSTRLSDARRARYSDIAGKLGDARVLGAIQNSADPEIAVDGAVLRVIAGDASEQKARSCIRDGLGCLVRMETAAPKDIAPTDTASKDAASEDTASDDATSKSTALSEFLTRCNPCEILDICREKCQLVVVAFAPPGQPTGDSPK
ncbi:MAG: hypothetical protein FWD57_03265 [Polyangiaceae bacterium]|nr:hypothetical protein [Polyangiaceae bacterium]